MYWSCEAKFEGVSLKLLVGLAGSLLRLLNPL